MSTQIGKHLLFFVDEGGFSDFSTLFTKFGYQVDLEKSPRKATQLTQKKYYHLLVAEFSYNPEFRDRVSNIESILASIQKHSPNAKIIVLFDTTNSQQLTQLKQRYKMDYTLSFPVSEKQMEQLLLKINQDSAVKI